MPNINQMTGGKYLKKEDAPQPMLLTVRLLAEEMISDGEGGKEKKWVMHFNELDKGLVMNTTNFHLAAQALGSDETDHWLGRQLVLYADPNVSMAGKLVGGLRLRARRTTAQAAPAPTPAPAPKPAGKFDDMADDIPF